MNKLLKMENELRGIANDNPISVKGIIVTKSKHVLLLRRPGETKWDLPGGGVDDGENIAEAYAREVMEETGLTVHSCEPVHTFLRDVPGKDIKLIQYVLTLSDDISVDTPITLSFEHEEFRYFSFSEIPALELMPSYREAFRLAESKIEA